MRFMCFIIRFFEKFNSFNFYFISVVSLNDFKSLWKKDVKD